RSAATIRCEQEPPQPTASPLAPRESARRATGQCRPAACSTQLCGFAASTPAIESRMARIRVSKCFAPFAFFAVPRNAPFHVHACHAPPPREHSTYRMKVIDRYVGRQVLTSSAFAVAVLSVVLVLGKIFKELLDVFVQRDAPLEFILSAIAYI